MGALKNKKILIPIVIVVTVIAILAITSAVKEKNAKDKAREEALARYNAQQQAQAQAQESTPAESSEPLSFDDQMQQSLIAQYGIPPEGFKWDLTGHLLPIGNDVDTAEGQIYKFIAALRSLDFATVQSCSSNSDTLATYQSYYSSIGLNNDYTNFLRKQMAVTLQSLAITGITQAGTFADGTQYFTVTLDVLDLTNKDFWVEDQDEIFAHMRESVEKESDVAKSNQYLYDYVYKAYQEGKPGLRSVDVTLTVSKQQDQGFLVTDDMELSALISYEGGNALVQYILNNFNAWLRETQMDEMFDTMSGAGEVTDDRYIDDGVDDKVYTGGDEE